MQFQMNDAIITSYHVAGTAPNVPEDNILIAFKSITLTQCTIDPVTGVVHCSATNENSQSTA
jgi:hypothetical protein